MNESINATVYRVPDKEPLNLATLPGTHVVVTVPAAFSGTCTNVCVPGLIDSSEDIINAGADTILVVSGDQIDALLRWTEDNSWDKEQRLTFASDFDQFELRNVIGSLADEVGRDDLPVPVAGLLRRSYSVIKDGKVIWQYKEEHSKNYSLDMNDMIDAISSAST